jgi:hypothetical protein
VVTVLDAHPLAFHSSATRVQSIRDGIVRSDAPALRSICRCYPDRARSAEASGPNKIATPMHDAG